MEKDPSPLDTLRQLKEWLDAGTITPAEFDTLKRKLLFSEQNAATPPAPASPVPPVAPITPASPVPVPPLVPPSAVTPPSGGGFTDTPTPPPVVMAPLVSEPERPVTPPISSLPPVTPTAPPVVPVNPSSPTETYSYTRERPAEPIYTNVPTESFEANELPDEPDETPYVAPARNPLSTVLIVGGILALLALIAYLTLGNRESEHLSSKSRTEQDSLSTTPEVGPQAEQIDLPPAAAPETVRVAPVVPPTAAPAEDTATTTAAPAAEATPAAPPVDESAVRSRIESTLSAYYEDMKAAPFSASQYFSPSVERFYTLQNTTPAAINEELTKSHFPEFLEASTEIEPGSLQISDVANDGSRVVTFLEKSQAFRQSQQKHQQTRAQVRVRFDKNYKIKYLRQERLLENTFTD
ncbi:SHOCT domain-containing protein [Hymenobacter cellulosilyticus]|uniref:SHOCT domain-containing protein n=1 Tax=Hymenobacter cellulosilyticus TaxID=2932248 RepID=A0A8T9Q8J2_9BACT|nr:SHOCT domain-containing protein [Hymenobacter cellulosilyticus]UOQ72408.1 SHOCT domain-containing protein [Hymenobacter cellulosilyticus]